MELRERLLHNEIQNLGQMVQIMSYEMAVLSDFLKEQFGASYTSYRARHSQQAKAPSSKKTNLTARKSTGTGPLKRENPESSSSESSAAKKLKTSDNQDEGEDCFEDALPESADYGDNSIDDQDNFSVGSNDFPEGAEIISFAMPKNEAERSLGGRNRKEIWNRYIVAKLPNGKLSAKCRKCFNYVSCKTERLTSHYTKCVVEGMSFSRKLHSSSSFIRTKSNNTSEEADKKKVTDYLAAKKGVQRESFQDGDKGGIRGRSRDPIWDYYNSTDDPCTGKKIARCKKCDVVVSPKVERLRRHFIVCHKLEDDDDADGGDGGGESDDDDSAEVA